LIDLPNFEKAFDYENNFYLTCNSTRMAKAIAQYRLFEKTVQIEGDIVECGIFKGSSFSRFAMFRKILNLEEKKLIGFDSFGRFPETEYDQDKVMRENFISSAGDQSISKLQLEDVLENKDCQKNTILIEGNITKTVPEFVSNNPDIKISLLNLDVDIYEPTVVILKYLIPLMSKGGIIILDDYNSFPGETKAVDQYINGKDIKINKPIFPNTPHFIVKECL
jgi:hypothetical protein